jgi:Putative MetA-pathway of phenol degradation
MPSMLESTFATVRLAVMFFCACFVNAVCSGQGLSPRAYVIVPVHSNAVTLTYSLRAGDVVFDQIVSTSNATGRISTGIFSYFHTLSFFGRSANINASIPYSTARFQGTLSGVQEEVYRSGLAPAVVRLSLNLKGGPAMSAKEFIEWEQKTLIGVSLTVTTAAGQYDPARLVNIGANRWAFKPELGVSHRSGKWVFDAYGAVCFFTANHDFYLNASSSHGRNTQTQQPVVAIETHLSYDVKPRLWLSVDGNYWYGGKTALNGVRNETTLQANSRLGATASLPIGTHHSLKFSYSTGTYIRFGGDYQDFSVAWQYSWLGRPK